MYGKEVLVFAPLKGHPGAMNIAVGDAVTDLLVQAKNGNKTSAETREMIVIALQKQAEEYIESRWPGYLKTFSIFK